LLKEKKKKEQEKGDYKLKKKEFVFLGHDW